MKKYLLLLITVVLLSGIATAQGFNITPQSSGGTVTCPECPEVSCVDSFPYLGNIDYIRFNTGVKTIENPDEYNSFCELLSSVNYIYMYDHIWVNGESGNPSLCTRYWYHYRNEYPTGSFPDAEVGAVTQYLMFDNTAGTSPSTFPTSWQNLTELRYLYLRRNNYTLAQMDNLVQELEAKVLLGMGGAYTGIHRVYTNGTGTGANASISLATHLSNGWQLLGTNRIRKVIAGRTWEIYFNI